MSDDGDPALCYYDTKSGKYLLLCLGTTINDVYQFSFSKENEVTGCYYLQYKSDGHLSSCYTLTGMRYDAGSSTAASASHETEAAQIERLKNLDCQSCEPDSALLERIDDLKKAAGQE